MTQKSLSSPHEEIFENDDKANALLNFVCEELESQKTGAPMRHQRFHVANRAHHALETYYFACTLLDVFDKTPVTKIKFNFSQEFNDQGGTFLATSATLSYRLKNPDGNMEEKSCQLYSPYLDDIEEKEMRDFLKENSEASGIISGLGNTVDRWEDNDISNFHATTFEKENVMPTYKKCYPEIYPLIEKFILSNGVVEAKEKAPSRSTPKL